MKRTMSLAIVLLVATATGFAGCATTSSESGEASGAQQASTVKAAFGVRKPKHVGVAMMTAREMLSGEAEQSADRVAIVACGPAIRTLGHESKFADRIRKSLDRGIEFKACGVTVERMGFDASTFIEGVEVVPNGFVELIRLQESGYHSVEL